MRGLNENHRQVEMVNDNELLVKVFIEYLRSFAIDERRLRARVQCSAEDVIAEQIRWSKITGHSGHPIYETDSEGS